MNYDHFLFLSSLSLFSISFNSIISPSLAEAKSSKTACNLTSAVVYTSHEPPFFLLFIQKTNSSPPPKNKNRRAKEQRFHS